MSVLGGQILKSSAIVEPLSDALIWTDFTNSNHYVLSGSNFTTIYNKGTGIGSVSQRSAPVYNNGFQHRASSVDECIYSETIPILCTHFIVGKHITDNVNSYFWGGSGNTRHFRHYALSNVNKGNIYVVNFANKNVTYLSSVCLVDHVICIVGYSTYLRMYINSAYEHLSSSSFSYSTALFSLSGSRESFSYNVGSQIIKEVGVYNTALSHLDILAKIALLKIKHGIS